MVVVWVALSPPPPPPPPARLPVTPTTLQGRTQTTTQRQRTVSQSVNQSVITIRNVWTNVSQSNVVASLSVPYISFHSSSFSPPPQTIFLFLLLKVFVYPPSTLFFFLYFLPSNILLLLQVPLCPLPSFLFHFLLLLPLLSLSIFPVLSRYSSLSFLLSVALFSRQSHRVCLSLLRNNNRVSLSLSLAASSSSPTR